jgi:hypothetical protein
MFALKNITRNQVNEASANMYDILVESAKGMPMYGVTDVNDPDKWENIVQKTNKPLLGTLGGSRYLSERLPWLQPGRIKRNKPM